VWALLAGCGARIPATLQSQVSWELGFAEIRRQPEAYIGRLVALGGSVLQIEAVDQGYRAVVSELPLDPSRHRPVANQPPRGLFLLLLPRRTLPPDLRPGREVTVVGEVLGKGTLTGAAEAEALPLLEERHTHVWGSSWWPQIYIGIGGGIAI
jgi:outer membrane lipoprotein